MYQECLQIEFAAQNIPFVAQSQWPLVYKGVVLEQYFKPDFICYGKIIVEIKAVSALADAYRAQALNYLNATDFELALLMNFGEFPKLAYERLANNRKREPTKSVLEEIQSWQLDSI